MTEQIWIDELMPRKRGSGKKVHCALYNEELELWEAELDLPADLLDEANGMQETGWRWVDVERES